MRRFPSVGSSHPTGSKVQSQYLGHFVHRTMNFSGQNVFEPSQNQTLTSSFGVFDFQDRNSPSEKRRCIFRRGYKRNDASSGPKLPLPQQRHPPGNIAILPGDREMPQLSCHAAYVGLSGPLYWLATGIFTSGVQKILFVKQTT